jgi:hypothetical protein
MIRERVNSGLDRVRGEIDRKGRSGGRPRRKVGRMVGLGTSTRPERPHSELAVASSTFAACTTGRSAGFSPLRTRPV